MTATEEEKFVVLLAIWERGGAPTKAETLDHIASAGYYHLTDQDLQWKDNRNEQHWRNHLAFTRKRLEQEGRVDGSEWDCWRITDKGLSYLKELATAVVNTYTFSKLTGPAQERASHLVSGG